jgi:hypothetical protein
MPRRKTPGPRVKDPKLYEELRDEGNSKEKSARIANAAANVPLQGGPQGRQEPLVRRVDGSRPAPAGVRDRCSGRSSMSTAELVKALRDH